MKIGIIGCSGRMGKALIESVQNNNATSLAGGLVKQDSDLAGIDLGQIARIETTNATATTNIEELIDASDAIIDFTTPELSIEIAKLVAKKNKINVIGTTGFSQTQFQELKKLSNNTPIIWSSNMSIGINILKNLTQKLASILDIDFDIEILEMHHKHKVDSPSGTALTLGEAAAKGRNTELSKVECKSRDGIIGAREKGEIGFATLRGGDVVGDHTVMFAGDGERIELTHKASSRKIFANGAVKAAIWAENQPAGFYSMQDVLGFTD